MGSDEKDMARLWYDFQSLTHENRDWKEGRKPCPIISYSPTTPCSSPSEYLTRWGPGLSRLGAIMSFGGYCVSRPGLLRLGAVVG